MKKYFRRPVISVPSLGIYILVTVINAKSNFPWWQELIGFFIAGVLSYILTDDDA